MAKKAKKTMEGKGPKLGRGPWERAHIEKELKRIGWVRAKAGNHINLKHPDLPGKVQLSSGWSGVKVGSTPFKGLMSQTGYTKVQLQQVLNGLDP